MKHYLYIVRVQHNQHQINIMRLLVVFFILFFLQQSYSQNKEWQIISPWKWFNISDVRLSDGDMYFLDKDLNEIITFNNELGEFTASSIPFQNGIDLIVVGDFYYILTDDNLLYTTNDISGIWGLVEHDFSPFPKLYKVQDKLVILDNKQLYYYENEEFTFTGTIDENDILDTGLHRILKFTNTSDVASYSDDLGESWIQFDKTGLQVFMSHHSDRILGITFEEEIFELKNNQDYKYEFHY